MWNIYENYLFSTRFKMSGKKRSSIQVNLKACFKTIYTEAFSYSTVREINVEHKPVAIFYRLVQLLILIYIIGYSFEDFYFRQ